MLICATSHYFDTEKVILIGKTGTRPLDEALKTDILNNSPHFFLSCSFLLEYEIKLDMIV